MGEAQKSAKVKNCDVLIPPFGLPATLRIPRYAKVIVIFVHGRSPPSLSLRNTIVADASSDAGCATLLFDRLTIDEAADRRNVFDIRLLKQRLHRQAVEQAPSIRNQRAMIAGKQLACDTTRHPLALPAVSVGAGNNQIGFQIVGNDMQLRSIRPGRRHCLHLSHDAMASQPGDDHCQVASHFGP